MMFFKNPFQPRFYPGNAWLLIFWLSSHLCLAGEQAPSLDAALAGQEDVWGNAALRQTNWPDYDFFSRLLPPLRYVNAQFRYYPIVLCAPAAGCKARLISNGSGVNSKANAAMWHELGMQVSFYVGQDAVPFGGDTNNLEEPRYLSGYLPVVQIGFHHQGGTFLEETFATTSLDLSNHGVLFTRFSWNGAKYGAIEAHIETTAPLQWVNHSVRDQQGCVLFWCDKTWSWDKAKKSLATTLAPGHDAVLATATKPIEPARAPALNLRSYKRERDKCIATWEDILARGAQADLPEPRVNNAWKSLVIGSLMLMDGNRMNYSAGNGYQSMFEAECGDMTRALLMWGNPDAQRTIVPLLDYHMDPALRSHDAAFKLQLLAHYYWLTRDRSFILAQRSRWSGIVDLLITNRETGTGLLLPEAYCGDQSQHVYSLSANANAWRGLRDMAVVLKILAGCKTLRASPTPRSLCVRRPSLR